MKKLALVTLVISLALSTVSFAGLTREIWDGTPAGNIDEAWAVINGETPPTTVDVIGAANVDDRGVDNYVMHLTGFVVAPVDGDYTFHIASDDNSQLLLDGVVVASVAGWTGAREWGNANATPSEPMTLTAGQILTIEAAMQEGTGGDNLAIGWLVPGSSAIAVLPDSATYASEAALAQAGGPSPADGAVKVVDGLLSWTPPLVGEAPVYTVSLGTDPETLAVIADGLTETAADAGALGAELAFSTTYYWSVSVNGGEAVVWSFTTADAVVINSVTGAAQPVGAAATLSVDAVSPVGAALTYEWHRLNFSPIPGLVIPDAAIPGAGAATYTVDAVTPADQGEYYVIVSSVDGSVASPVVFLDVQTGLIHQWTFNSTPDGVTVPDVVGGANGMLINQTGLSAFADGQLRLGNDGSQGSAGGGNNQSNGDYVDLPNGIISALTQMTIEVWTTWHQDTQGWARIYDFGTSNTGENNSSGAGNAGIHSMYLCPKSGGNNASGNTIIEYRLGGSAPQISPGGRMALNQETMLTQTHDDKNRSRVKMYVNGIAVGGYDAPFPLKNMVDNNNWLGRSQWGDPMYNGSYNEMRIYDTLLSAEQIAADYVAGPDAMGVIPPDAAGNRLVGDINRDGVYDFLDVAMAADQWLSQRLDRDRTIAERNATIAELQAAQ